MQLVIDLGPPPPAYPGPAPTLAIGHDERHQPPGAIHRPTPALTAAPDENLPLVTATAIDGMVIDLRGVPPHTFKL